MVTGGVAVAAPWRKLPSRHNTEQLQPYNQSAKRILPLQELDEATGPATKNFQVHVERLALAASTAMTACNAVQHNLLDLDAALVQGAIALDDALQTLPLEEQAASVLNRGNGTTSGGGTTAALQLLGAQLAALQAEVARVAVKASNLMLGQTEFGSEVQQWACMAMPKKCLIPFDVRVKEVLEAAPCTGSLRDLCARHDGAQLRNKVDPSAPQAWLPPPQHNGLCLSSLAPLGDAPEELQKPSSMTSLPPLPSPRLPDGAILPRPQQAEPTELRAKRGPRSGVPLLHQRPPQRVWYSPAAYQGGATQRPSRSNGEKLRWPLTSAANNSYIVKSPVQAPAAAPCANCRALEAELAELRAKQVLRRETRLERRSIWSNSATPTAAAEGRAASPAKSAGSDKQLHRQVSIAGRTSSPTTPAPDSSESEEEQEEDEDSEETSSDDYEMLERMIEEQREQLNQQRAQLEEVTADRDSLKQELDAIWANPLSSLLELGGRLSPKPDDTPSSERRCEICDAFRVKVLNEIRFGKGDLEAVLLDHWGGDPECPPDVAVRVLQAHKAQRRWVMGAAYARQLIASRFKGMLPVHRAVALGIAELCDRHKTDFQGMPMGIYEFIGLHAHTEEFKTHVHSLIGHSRRGDVRAKEFADLSSLEASMRRAYHAGFKEAGGKAIAEGYYAEVNRLLSKLRTARGTLRKRQDVGFEIMGLDALYDVSRTANEKLAREIYAMAQQTGGKPKLVSLKGRIRARAKKLTKYGNDTACLTDLMRASIVYHSVADLYRGLLCILEKDLAANRRDFFITEVQDRFQNCKDGYRDINMNFEVDGIIGEVQLHVEQILRAKSSSGHQIYTVQRQVNELLFEACVQNAEADILSLVKEYNVCAKTVRDKNGRSALHYSSHLGSALAVSLLLRFDADPWATDSSSTLPCELALRRGHFDVVCMLLDKMMEEEHQSQKPQATSEVDPKASKEADGEDAAEQAERAAPQRPNHNAALMRLGRHVVPWLCDHIISQPTEMPLKTKLRWMDLGKRLIKVLESFGAVWPAQEWLMVSATEGQVPRVRILLDVGVDVPASLGQASALDLAIQCGRVDMAIFLSHRGVGGDLACARCNKDTVHVHLQLAAQREDGAYASAALAAKGDPNSISASLSKRRTPLMAFAAAGNLRLCMDLVESRANVVAQDAFHCSPAHYARSMGHRQVEDFLESEKNLLERPLKLQVEPMNYLSQAAKHGCCGAVSRILGAVQPTDTRPTGKILSQSVGPYGQTALHCAIQATRDADPTAQVCRALILAGADLFAKTQNGDSSLHLAAAMGNRDLFNLLEHEARARIGNESTDRFLNEDFNDFGQTPRTCLERTLMLRDKKVEQASVEDSLSLKLAGFNSFVRTLVNARLNRWREKRAVTLHEILHQRRDRITREALKEFSVDEYEEDLNLGAMRRRAQILEPVSIPMLGKFTRQRTAN